MSRKVALLIGVGEYGEGIPSLSAPLNDVVAMKQVLENSKMGGFDEVTIRTNPDPTAMRLAVQQVFAGLSKNDLVLLFFSGHGITDDNNRLYFATKGTSKDYYEATSVSASFIQDISLKSYAKRQVMILDCCFSGAFAEGWQPKGLELDLERELGAEGRVVLTSSTATQKSFQQTDGEFSLYTKYILEGIETGAADKNSDGKISAQELHEYAKAKVQEVKPKQKPGIINDKEGFNILISQAPINDPELSFRKLVEKYTVEGQITVTGNYILQVKQRDLEITDGRAEEIINEVLAPYRKRIENIGIYREAFTETVKLHYPLTERFINDLQDLQDILGLENKDVAKIKEQILAEKEAEYQQDFVTRNLQPNRIPEEKSTSKRGGIFSFIGQALSSTFEKTSKNFFDSASDKQDKGDNQGAIEDYTQAIQIDHNWGNPSGTYFGFPTAYYNRGNAHKALQEYPKAIADYSKAIELNPEYASAYNSRGNTYYDLKEYQKAIADYNKALELNPDDADAYNNRGNVYYDLEEYQKAIADYNKAIELNPEHASAYYNRGMTHRTLANYQTAIDDCTNAIKLKSDYAVAYTVRGNVYSDIGDYSAAINDYTESIKHQNPELWLSYKNRGNAYKAIKEYQKAIADYSKAIELNHDYATAYKNRGNLHYNLKNYQKAIADYNKAIELNPDYADAYYDRGLAYEKQGNMNTAIKNYQKASELYRQQGNTEWHQNAVNKVKKLEN